MVEEKTVAGVYFVHPDGERELVHQYQDGDYVLTDVIELFLLGRQDDRGPEGEAALLVSRKELRELKVQADAQSFDHEEGFIEMCLDIYRFASAREESSFLFVSIE